MERTDHCQEIGKKSKFHPINMPPVTVVGWWIIPIFIPTSSNRPVQSSFLLPDIDPIPFLSNWIYCFLDHYDFCFEFPENLFDWGFLTEASHSKSFKIGLLPSPLFFWILLDSFQLLCPSLVLNIFSEILRTTNCFCHDTSPSDSYFSTLAFPIWGIWISELALTWWPMPTVILGEGRETFKNKQHHPKRQKKNQVEKIHLTDRLGHHRMGCLQIWLLRTWLSNVSIGGAKISILVDLWFR